MSRSLFFPFFSFLRGRERGFEVGREVSRLREAAKLRKGTSFPPQKKNSKKKNQVCILDRPRHAELIRQVRATGARIRLISDGDVAAAIETARPGSPVDVMLGIGGTPEGVVAAAALKCLGGSIQGRLAPREEFGERERALALGYDLSRILFTDDLCGGDDVFFAATGVSDGDLLRGVRFEGGGRGRTQSIVMRAASGTVRTIETEHRWGQARAGRREVKIGRAHV